MLRGRASLEIEILSTMGTEPKNLPGGANGGDFSVILDMEFMLMYKAIFSTNTVGSANAQVP